MRFLIGQFVQDNCNYKCIAQRVQRNKAKLQESFINPYIDQSLKIPFSKEGQEIKLKFPFKLSHLSYDDQNRDVTDDGAGSVTINLHYKRKNATKSGEKVSTRKVFMDRN